MPLKWTRRRPELSTAFTLSAWSGPSPRRGPVFTGRGSSPSGLCTGRRWLDSCGRVDYCRGRGTVVTPPPAQPHSLGRKNAQPQGEEQETVRNLTSLTPPCVCNRQWQPPLRNMCGQYDIRSPGTALLLQYLAKEGSQQMLPSLTCSSTHPDARRPLSQESHTASLPHHDWHSRLPVRPDP